MSMLQIRLDVCRRIIFAESKSIFGRNNWFFVKDEEKTLIPGDVFYDNLYNELNSARVSIGRYP